MTALGDYVIIDASGPRFKQGIVFEKQAFKVLDFGRHVPPVETLFFKEPATDSPFHVPGIRSSQPGLDAASPSKGFLDRWHGFPVGHVVANRFEFV